VASPVPRADAWLPGLANPLTRFQERWSPKELAELAQQVREFADSLDDSKPNSKTKNN
jgi:hypothetical protein